MLKHPYIDMYIAKSIVVFREENGRFTRLEQLKETTLMYDELYDRVKRYIKLED
jgi:DNA uptake protein ComE-like DNA-binding protein